MGARMNSRISDVGVLCAVTILLMQSRNNDDCSAIRSSTKVYTEIFRLPLGSHY